MDEYAAQMSLYANQPEAPEHRVARQRTAAEMYGVAKAAERRNQAALDTVRRAIQRDLKRAAFASLYGRPAATREEHISATNYFVQAEASAAMMREMGDRLSVTLDGYDAVNAAELGSVVYEFNDSCCSRCGTWPARLQEDPYAAEINADHTPVMLCDSCADASA